MKNVKIRRIILIGALSLAVISTVIAAWPGTRPGSTTGAIASLSVPEYKYVVRSHNGYVAVFVAGEDAPSYITETKTATLPEHDRQLLEQGLLIYTEEELTAVLEDYES